MTDKPVSFGQAMVVWLKIGLMSFGGPAGQIALMHRILVEEKKWISEPRFLHALNYCMLLPGPEAQQLATYVGWYLHRSLGGLTAGLLFVLPGALVMLFLSVLYVAYRDLSLVMALFLGIKAAVLAIVAEALLRISRRALQTPALYAMAAAAFAAIFFLDIPFPLIVLGAGLVGFAGASTRLFTPAGRKAGIDDLEEEPPPPHTRPRAMRTVLTAVIFVLLWAIPLWLLFTLFGGDHIFTELAVFFSKMAVVTFGGAYAVLAYVGQQAVEIYGWLAPGEMLDGLGLAETTPGPLILVLQFVGFLAAFRDAGGSDPFITGFLGALVVLWFTFVPCFFWVFTGAPYIEHLRSHKKLNSALTAITAAAVGVIMNLAVWFALHVVFGQIDERRVAGLRLLVPDFGSLNLTALALALVAAFALFRWRIGMGWTLVLSGLLGVGLSFLDQAI